MSMLAPKRPEPVIPAHREIMFFTVLRFVIASIVISILAWWILTCQEEARGQDIFLKESSLVSDPGVVTLAWYMAAGSDGSIVRAGIESGNYLLSWDAGTNQQITITNLKGGYTWYFVAEDYHYTYVTVRTNEVRRARCSGPSNEVAWSAPCPQGEPQLLITNGVWLVMCEISGGGVLQTSHDLRHWTSAGNIPTNAPALFQGPVIGNQFFRIQ